MDMTPTVPHPIIIRPDQVPSIKVFDLEMKVLLSSDATHGSTSVLMAWHKPGEGAANHVHFNQDEIFFVVEGLYEIVVGDQAAMAGPGTLVFIPRTVIHRFRNVGGATACMLDWSLPGGQDRYFAALAELTACGNFTAQDAQEISWQFDMSFRSS